MLPNSPEQLKLDLDNLESEIRRISILPGENKTLKVKLRKGITLEEASLVWYRYVMDNTQNVNRVEFRYGSCGYIVIAKLKDKEEVGE